MTSFFDSSICEVEPITRLVFIGMIVLSDRKGKLDVTTEALARRLNLPHKAVAFAIETLAAPDPRSRSRAEEGRRIRPIDDARAWGWIVVNKESYRDAVRDDDEIRSQNAARKARQRSKKNPTAKRITDTDTDTASATCHAPSRSKRDIPCEFDQEREFSQAFDHDYPRAKGRNVGREEAQKEFNLTVGTVADLADFRKAIANYNKACSGGDQRYVLKASRWFKGWRDYVNIESGPPSPLSGDAIRPDGIEGLVF